MIFNYALAQYAIQNNLHVEYFIWSYLKNVNQSGLYHRNLLIHPKIKQSCINRKLKNNIFFKISGDRIILSGTKKLKLRLSNKNFIVNFEEISKFANKNSLSSGEAIKGWNNTIIKYFFISMFASRYEDERPYALSLLESDLEISASTIQRALKVFAVDRSSKIQNKYSPRSYICGRQRVCLSPNYYQMPIGRIKIAR